MEKALSDEIGSILQAASHMVLATVRAVGFRKRPLLALPTTG